MRFQKIMCTKSAIKLLMIALLGAVMAVSGCAIVGSKHKLYDGEVTSAVTILSSPTVQVAYIDNRICRFLEPSYRVR